MLRQLFSLTLGALLLAVVSAWARTAEARPPDATLLLDNLRFVYVQVSVDGHDLGRVTAEGGASFRLRPGEHSLRVRDASGRMVVAQELWLHPTQTERVVVPPREGQLTVRNATGRDGRLLVDGLDRGLLLAGQARALVLEPGSVGVQIVQPGRVLDAARLSLSPGEKSAWNALAPTVADLLLSNPLPVAVSMRVEGLPELFLAPGAREVLRVRPGPTEILVAQVGGRPLGREVVAVDPWDGGRFVAPLPREGFVRVVNLGRESVDIYADGRRLASVPPRGQCELTLPLGLQDLTLRERTRDLTLRTRVEVAPFEEVTLRCDLARHAVSLTSRLVAEVEDLLALLRRLAA